MNTTEIGNQNFNSCRLGNIGELRALRFSLNGALYPLSYRMLTLFMRMTKNSKLTQVCIVRTAVKHYLSNQVANFNLHK